MTPLFSLIRKEIIKIATQKEFETIQEAFEIIAVKAIFNHLLKEELITLKEYETLIKGLDEKMNNALVK